MIILEFKLKGTPGQYQALDEAIRTTQFIRNKCVRLWQDTWGTTGDDLNRYCRILAQEYTFVQKLNSMARQAAAERAWAAISHFYANCKKKKPGKKDTEDNGAQQELAGAGGEQAGDLGGGVAE